MIFTEKFDITGMTCAACSSRVEKAVSKLDGVSSCAVNLLTNSMTVETSLPDEEIIAAVEKAGYGAKKAGEKRQDTRGKIESSKKNTEIKPLIQRLVSSVIFLVILMYFSMGHMISLPLPSFLENNYVAIGIIQLVLTMIIMFINRKFFISGFKGVVNRAPNMDTLVSLGAGAAFVYSLYALFMMTDAQTAGNSSAAAGYLHEFYFESAAMILTLITVGKTLEAYSKGRTTSALEDLLKLAPQTATIIENGKEKEIPVSEVKKGDIFTVKPGGKIPVDGIILEGTATIDESALTGESIPADKEKGDEVSAATVNMSGFIKCEAKRVGEDTTLSKIIKMVNDASATKAPISKIADKVSGIFVPTVIVIAIITTVAWLLSGEAFSFALARGISVLVISCPCALGLATPVAIMVGSGVGAKHGILFKTAEALEETGKIKTIALDKTGTITEGKPSVTDIIPFGYFTEEKLLSFAAAIEAKSEHPIAKAVLARFLSEKKEIPEVENFKNFAGKGLEAEIEGKTLTGGNLSFSSERCKIPKEASETAEELANSGKTPLFFTYGGDFAGIIAISDTIKKDSPTAIERLKKLGIKTIMLTGDTEKTALAISRKAGTDEVIAGVLPNEKADTIKRLQKNGKVAMIGDGINDAPALIQADIGIAIGAGTDIAIDSADVVLTKSALSDAAAAVRLGRSTLRNIKENLFWAFFYNALGIPLAAGVFIPIFGWQLNPMFAAAAMSLSSFCVVMNALRLNLVKIYNKEEKTNVNKRTTEEQTKRQEEKTNKNETIKTNLKKETEENKMTLKIKGMMCEHCKAHVEEALKRVDGITSVRVDLQNGTAEVEGSAAKESMEEAVKNAGYEVTDIKLN